MISKKIKTGIKKISNIFDTMVFIHKRSIASQSEESLLGCDISGIDSYNPNND